MDGESTPMTPTTPMTPVPMTPPVKRRRFRRAPRSMKWSSKKDEIRGSDSLKSRAERHLTPMKVVFSLAETTQSTPMAPSRPRVRRRLGPDTAIKVEKPRAVEFNPDYDILRKFEKIAFLNHGDHVFRGYIRRNESVLGHQAMPICLVDIVGLYYMDQEAGIFQLAFHIRETMKSVKISSISKRIAKKMIVKMMRRDAVKGAAANTKEPAFYFDELIRTGFLLPCSPRAHSQKAVKYMFPFFKEWEFSCGVAVNEESKL